MQKHSAVVVVGAGVIGLTVACKLQESGKYSVVIVAENVPGTIPAGEAQSVKWASPWAGAHWRAWASNSDTVSQEMEMKTYHAMLKMAAEIPESGIHVAQGIDLFEEQVDDGLWYASTVNDASDIPPECLPGGIQYGLQYSTLVIDVPTYLVYLSARFLSLGGSIIKQRIDHILDATQYALESQTLALPTVVNCTGLGSRYLGGVQDKALYPSRGQTLLVSAPYAKRSITRIGRQFAYVIPRGNGTAVLGGTSDLNEWECNPDPSVTDRIIRRALELEPKLLPVEARALDKKKQADALKKQIISVNVGLRPMREGGVRLECETIARGVDSTVTVVHCYGHAGFGYQSSAGYADKVRELVDAVVI